MKLIILTQYFPPETGAPQNRLFELALRLQKHGVEVRVLTAMPNYPQMRVYDGYRRKIFKTENVDGIKTYRSWIYSSSSKKIIPRLLNYFSFVISSLISGLFVLRRSDYLLVESPPLFLGISAYLLSRMKRTKLIFNVSDLWPESAEKLGIITSRSLLSPAYRLEAFCYRKASLITGQTQGICSSIRARFPEKDVYWLPNGVDADIYNPEIVDKSLREALGFRADDFVLLYAGILGYAQGLQLIIDAAEKLAEYEQIKFVLLGQGPEKDSLLESVRTKGLKNVFFPESVQRTKMPAVVSQADATIIPLKKLELFTGAIPSKIFESLSMQKPIILGVDGEARRLFIEEANAGLFFEPENLEELCRAVLFMYDNPGKRIGMGKNGRKYVKENFNRNDIALKLLEKLKT